MLQYGHFLLVELKSYCPARLPIIHDFLVQAWKYLLCVY